LTREVNARLRERQSQRHRSTPSLENRRPRSLEFMRFADRYAAGHGLGFADGKRTSAGESATERARRGDRSKKGLKTFGKTGGLAGRRARHRLDLW